MFDRRTFLSGSAAALGTGFLKPDLAYGASQSVAANVEAYLNPIVERRDYSGFVLMERDGRPLVSTGFGFADDKARIPHTADTHYASASVGKMFTQAAILSLEKAGKLNRGDSIARFLPHFPSASSISVQHLLDHRAGIARDLPPGTDLMRPRTLEELVRMIAAIPLEGKAGERSAYSNNGYRMLARIIELAGGGDYDSLVRETVFEPRGMRNTFANMPGVRFAQRTRGHWPGPGWRSKVEVRAIDMSNRRGEGSFAITPNDMLVFLKTLPLEPGDLSDAKDSSGAPIPRAAGHDGFGEGYANLTYVYPEERAYLVSLSNMEAGAFMPMHVDMRRLLFGAAVAAPSVPEAAAVANVGDFDRYTGDYDLRPGAPLLIRRSGEILTVDAGEGPHPLIALGRDRFFMRLRYATMAFEGPTDAPANFLRWTEGGGEFPLKRIA